MNILPELLTAVEDFSIVDVRIGIHWTIVVVDRGGMLQAGLAATQSEIHLHTREPDVPMAGDLIKLKSRELAEWSLELNPLRASIGMATINACLNQPRDVWQDANAEEVISSHGKDKHVVLVGHFPFVPELKLHVKELVVLEQNPTGDDLPASAASRVIPQADVLAITGMALANHTLEELLAYRSAHTFTLLIGPSTTLHPILFRHGIDWLSGAVVIQVEPVSRAVSQGANFHQLRKAGVRLVNLARAGWSVP